MTLPHLKIYTDGGCQPNPGPGGWACILLQDGQPPQEFSGAEADTTNNRMELQAAIEALSRLKHPHHIDFYTDSQYLRRGITEWLAQWQAKDWQRAQGQTVQNQDLWQALATAITPHQIKWHWTKGHAGNRWNERADALASAQIPQASLPLNDANAVHIFTGAAYSGKDNRGGWAVLMRYQEHERSLTGQVPDTSANRMHLQAAIEGLSAMKKNLPIHLYTASDYLKDGATQWIVGWKKRGWQTKSGQDVSNRDLWESLDALQHRYHVEWHRVNKDNQPPEIEHVKTLASQAKQ